MGKTVCLITLMFSFLLLGGCGGEEEEAAVDSQPVKSEAASKANNPLANQQQLIKDARGIQSILDKDAEKKKKAADNIN